ncbi:glycosyltransferase family 4 protein [Chloroflexota bacterium]
MNILMVVEGFFPLIAGECTRTYGLCYHLIKEGCQVTLLTFRQVKTSMKKEEIDGIKVIRVPWHRHKLYALNTLALLLRMTQLLLTRQYHILHVRGPLFIAYARLISFLLRIPVIYEIFTVDVGSSSRIMKFVEKINKTFLKRVDGVILNCARLKSSAIKRGCLEQNIVALPNGVNLSNFFPRHKDEEITTRYHLNNKKIILYLGNFYEHEYLTSLIDVFVGVKNKMDGVKLILVGDGPERGKIEESIKRHNLANDVILTGFVPYSEAPRYYSVCDVFVMMRPKSPLADHILPIKPVEVMAMGKVIISTDVGGMREIIEDGKTGFLTSHSPDAISNKIIEVLNAPSLQEEIGANARAYVEKEHNWENIAKKLVNTYNDLIGTSNRSPL